jgi:protein-disulfide isomerase
VEENWIVNGGILQMLKRVAFLLMFACGCAMAQTKPAATTADQQLLNKVEAYLRNLFAWTPEYQVKMGALEPSGIADLYKVDVQVSGKGQTQSGTVYVSKDGHYLIRGEVRDMNADPFADNLAKLKTGDMPTKGPADAKVTFVEFSDFECPHCQNLYTILKTVEPEFPQVRWVIKDFPLESIHPWAMTAALAARCAYKVSPDAYWRVQDSIFTNQDSITADNAWDQISGYAVSAGVNVDSLHACMADPATKKFVEDEIAEGKSLGVESTPTIFINGRPITSGTKDLLEQILKFELSLTGEGNQPTK